MHHHKMDKPNFFDEGSPFLQHPLLTPERSSGEVDFILSRLKLGRGERVLDVGCGFGRHSLELARRGLRVTGIDASAAMIAAARARAGEAGLEVDFQAVRAEDFQSEQPYRAAVCLFTTLGQISAQGDSSGLPAAVAAVLEPGGYFVVEVPQREAALKAMRASEKFGQGESYTRVERSFDAQRSVMQETFTLVSPGSTRQYLLRYRLFSAPELQAVLAQAGFEVLEQFGGYQAGALDANSPSMLFVSRSATA